MPLPMFTRVKPNTTFVGETAKALATGFTKTVKE
jgi:hypothetical protein